MTVLGSVVLVRSPAPVVIESKGEVHMSRIRSAVALAATVAGVATGTVLAPSAGAASAADPTWAAAASGSGTSAAPSALAADPRTRFEPLRYGASYALGYIRWHARGVDVDYSIKAYGCRTLWAFGYDHNDVLRGFNYRTVCDTTKTDTMDVPVDVPGGASRVLLQFDDETGATRDWESYPHP
ncbi:hypothetical protein AB0F15_13090 [Amycolatopsis sp. NPDC026612]|uniref:hypothetical protein n=1 Tax=Amycolatopsis sp. NPDC026612 TaxID=3155466 RepID=UPI0033FAD8DA